VTRRTVVGWSLSLAHVRAPCPDSRVEIGDWPDPTIQKPTDVIVELQGVEASERPEANSHIGR
jgi:hypothetical protein